MKISQTGPGTSVDRSRKTGKASQSGDASAFRQHIENTGSASTDGPGAMAPLAALNSLLAIQEVPDAMVGKRRAVLQGDALLDELKALQIDLVQGSVSEDRLRSLSGMLDQPRPAIDDPELTRLLDDIELRAAVELAKFERQPS